MQKKILVNLKVVSTRSTVKTVFTIDTLHTHDGQTFYIHIHNENVM